MKSTTLMLLLGILSALSVKAQRDFAGVIGQKLVYFSKDDASHEVIFSLTPEWGDSISRLIYVPTHQKFYGIWSFRSNPGLASIDLNGRVRYIAKFKMKSNDSVYFADAIAWDSVNCKLYASLSLNGDPPMGDYSAESLVLVNPENAECTLASKVKVGTADADMDGLAFLKDTLIMMNISEPNVYFYQVHANNITPVISQSLWYNAIPNMPISAIAVAHSQLYYTSTYRIYHVDRKKGIQLVGQTHKASEGASVGKIGQIHDFMIERSIVDTALCIGDSITLNARTSHMNGLTYQWSTGAESSSSVVSAEDSGVVTVIISNPEWCFNLFDTSYIQFKDCDSTNGIKKGPKYNCIGSYPNPASDLLNVSLGDNSKPTTISLYTSGGQLVDKVFATGDEEIILDVKGYSTGMYYLVCQSEDELFSAKVVVVND